MEEAKEYWIFTFGFEQAHPGKYVKVYGDFDEARNKMCLKYGKNWCMQYSPEEWGKIEKRNPRHETYLETIK